MSGGRRLGHRPGSPRGRRRRRRRAAPSAPASPPRRAPLGDLPPERPRTGRVVRRHRARRPGAPATPPAPILLRRTGSASTCRCGATCGRTWPRVPVRGLRSPVARRERAPADGDLSLRAMGRDIAAVLEAVAPDRPRRWSSGTPWARWPILAMAEQRPELFGDRGRGRRAARRVASDLAAGRHGVGHGVRCVRAWARSRGRPPCRIGSGEPCSRARSTSAASSLG